MSQSIAEVSGIRLGIASPPNLPATAPGVLHIYADADNDIDGSIVLGDSTEAQIDAVLAAYRADMLAKIDEYEAMVRAAAAAARSEAGN